uniref:Uncharacterized protein n=1 Tax=Candidatus Kentrum sp. LFY TaxID=2126342 RepID=A0A450UEZ5_9GAMM|nr:MAG: hypothetical protein BECKLFY1418A_GA0070994_101443 [Candidatus Kentron sp. LFY]
MGYPVLGYGRIPYIQQMQTNADLMGVHADAMQTHDGKMQTNIHIARTHKSRIRAYIPMM